MNPKEHAEDWSVRADRVHIGGTKRPGRVRDVPKAFPSALWPHVTLPRPSVGAKNFWRWFRLAADHAGVPCTPYDLRRSFANWMEAAGIIRARRMAYLGHGARDITDLYERHEVEAYLIEDGAKLRAWIDLQLGQVGPPRPSGWRWSGDRCDRSAPELGHHSPGISPDRLRSDQRPAAEGGPS
jgi:hypothetical protein